MCAVVAAIAVSWGVRAFVGERSTETVLAAAVAASPVAPSPAIDQNPTPPLPAAAAPDPVPVGRFELFKVNMQAGQAPNSEAAAWIAVDGLPPKAYRIGDTVVGAVVLQSVQPRSAALGPAGGPAAIVLQVSDPAASAGAAPANGADSRRLLSDVQPPIRAASAPPVNRQPVPVTDPDHGVDTSNH